MPRRVEIADMVGIIAMAGTVEEYDESCKKPKKDAEDSSTNTITSYFSPLSKSIDTAFPSPKSSNIMDYFKKTPSGRNVASNASGESEGKNSAVKGLSRRINFSQKLNECHEVAEISDTSNSSVAEACGVRSGVGVFGSDTAALIAQLCAESQELFEENETSVFVGSNTVRRRTKAGNRKKSCKEPVNHSSRKISKKTRKRKAAGNSKDPSRQSDVEPEATDDCCERGVEKPEAQGATIPVVVESERMCLSETSLDTTADETCQMNDSTVTVSFEDFIKNQESEESSAEKAAGDDDTEIIEESNKLPNLTEDMSSAAQSISPKTMTVHVQIHSSPTSTSAHNSKLKKKKIASIFLRKKADSESEAVEIQLVSPHPVESTDPAPARRSNVVIAEEELELSVLDATDKSPVKVKCSRAEREQFMNAFRRPLSSDPAKIGLKKAAQKPKTPKEGFRPDEAAEGGVDESSVEKGKEEFVQVTKAEMSSKGSHDSRTEKRESGATAKKNKKLKRGKVRKAECKSPEDCEVTGEEIDPNLKTCDEAIEESRDSKPFDPATTRSSETCRITRRSLRQQRDARDCSLIPDKAIGVVCLGVPARRSTPKLTCWSSEENSIYKAEMIPMTCNKSPIRMKFIRITRSKNDAKAEKMHENTEFTPRSNQRMRRSKNMVKAKRLVEKAKVQSKCRNPVESITPLRRSSRRQGRSDEKFCGTEDLEIMLNSSAESDSDCIIQSEKKSKNLRNLSDVLRRNPGSTSTKSTPADLQVASIFCGKKAVKAIPSEPITIVDENSCNGSENSQDDEQFRAKRQFLMSGLPDTLKKHIAKTAAVMEVYSAAGATFQTVVHVQQKSQVSLLWNLAWPNSAILTRLQDVNEGIEGILKVSLSLGDFSEVKHKTTAVASWTGLSNWRTEFSQDIQKCLLEEIRLSNPAFPVRKLFKLLLQKRNEHLAEALKAGPCNKSDSSVIELDAEPQQMLSLCSSSQPSLGKRKRKKERQEQKQKRRKTLDSDEDSVIIIDAEDLPTQPERSTKRNSRGAQKQNCVASSKNRLSRSMKKKQQELECISGAAETQNVPAPPRVCGLTDQTKAEEAAASDDLVKEDLLWTEKYQPQHSSQLVGNISAVRKLHSWLMEWKKRADQEAKKQKEKKTEKDKKLDAWDNSDFNMESSEDEDFLCNTVLITGPPGVGKTAAVYACAQELGFKVFEVNASSQRSGRQILSQLKEATQSHQVDKQGANALKPAFFNSNKLLPSQTAKSPRKANSPKKMISSPRKAAQSPKGRRSKKNLAPMSLTNFFKGLSKPPPNNSEETERPEDKEMDEKTLKNDKAQKSWPQVTEVTRAPSVSESKDTGPEESSRKSATSLILFEEVDVIFDDDAGFLNAIKTFMATAKRPVILTTTDPNFSLMFECCFEEICFKVPSSANVASYLQLLCLAENLRTDTKDLTALLALNKCDIRQSILHLQFWAKSGGGYHVNKPLPAEEISTIPSPAQEELVGNAVAAEDTLENSSKSGSVVKTQDVPRCNTGCTENLLGLKLITGCSSDLFSMFKQEIVSLEQWRSQVQILLEFQRRQLDFISHNLEILLPLPVRVVPDPKGPETLTAEDAELPVCNPARPAATLPQGSNASVDASPVKTSRKLKHQRKVVMFDDSDLFDTELNESDTFVTLPNEIPTSPCVVGNVAESQASGVSRDGPSGNKTDCSKVTKKKPRTQAEQKCCESVSLCLGLLAEFTDSVSFLDCCLHRGAVEREGTCGQSGYHWAAAEIKNGMLDEGRAESGDWCSSYSFGEMRATVEALSWEKCRSQIQQIMEPSVTKCEEPEKGPMEELTLQTPNRQNSNAAITQFSHRHTSAASKRIEVLKTVFSSKAFVSLGNRRASAVDYLPALRTICRTEKLKEQGKLKRRFLHYLDSAHLELPKHILETLATSFP
ncbi:ATPase family AAA domain-containing protein 5 isoform X2 [Scyliorhinus torazame]|uniref:ATPase family AAA domain-containing protein 5 isoform X2 n=1 Tax=Scyliorhinus torazame TaxID=75743 RepID=UPI003B5B813C